MPVYSNPNSGRLAIPGAAVTVTGLSQEDNTRTGASSVCEWEGSYEDLLVKKAWAQGAGAGEVIGPDSKGNGYYKLVAHFPFGFDGEVTSYYTPPSVHELETCISQTPIWRSSKIRTRLTPQQIGIVQRVVSDYQAGKASGDLTENDEALAEAAVVAKIAKNGGAVSGVTNLQAQTYGLDLFRAVALLGVEDFIEYYSVYRRSLTAATPEQVRVSMTDTGKIWTTPEIIAAEGVSATGFFDLDTTLVWIKSRPQVVGVAGQKTQVIYSYTESKAALEMTYDAKGLAVKGGPNGILWTAN